MANVITSEDLGQDKAQQPGTQEIGAFTSPAGRGQSGPSQSAPAQGSPSNPNQQKGSGYTNIQRVLQANQGNQLGQAVGGGIEQAGQQAQNNLQNAQNQFQQQTNQNQFNTSGNKQLVQDVLANPEQYVSGQQGSQFSKLITGQYGGPQGLQNSQQLQSQAADVNQLNQAIGSQGGKYGLLQRFVGNPQYTGGQQTLDALLLGQKGNQQDLIKARNATSGLYPQIQNSITGAQAQGQQASNQAKQFGQGVQNQFGQTVGDINSKLQNTAFTSQQARDKQYNDAIGRLQSGTITQADADLLGLTQGQQVTGDVLQNIGQYLQENPLKASAQNVASAQDYARLNALQQLAGNAAPASAQNILGTFAGQNQQAGQFGNTQTFDPNKTGFQTILGSQLENYHNQVDNPQASLAQAQKIMDIWNDPTLTGWGQKAALIGQFAPGALGGNFQQNVAWAQNNLATQQQKYNDALAAANAATGGLKNITINPDGSTS